MSIYSKTWRDDRGLHGKMDGGVFTVHLADGKYDGWIWHVDVNDGSIPCEDICDLIVDLAGAHGVDLV